MTDIEIANAGTTLPGGGAPDPSMPASNDTIRHFVEIVASFGPYLLIVGWAEPALSEARIPGEDGALLANFHPRGDVSVALGVDDDAERGFAVIVPLAPAAQGRLHLHGDQIVVEASFDANDPPALDRRHLHRRPGVASAVAAALGTLDPNGPDFSELAPIIPSTADACPAAMGFLETAFDMVPTDFVVVGGWFGAIRDVPVWVEADDGTLCLLDAPSVYRYERREPEDVLSEKGKQAHRPAFLLAMQPQRPARRVRMRALFEGAIYQLHAVDVTCRDAEPGQIAHYLFGITSPISEFAARCAIVDGPVLAAAIAASPPVVAQADVRAEAFGALPPRPAVTIVVPLYGVHAFVEHQLQAFTRDPWIRANAEIVYVIDDPEILDRARSDVAYWHTLYGIAFRLVWSQRNLGYSGANNLGAAHATAPVLLFLNSDVFPTRPGWIEPMIAELTPNGRQFGVVGARLHYPDGTIQHDGMERRPLPEFGIDINDHPRLGLDPSLFGTAETRAVDAVTGACLAIPRALFKEIGGWSGAYLRGDFEDSDLCASVRTRGHGIGIVPDLGLVHLERQSMALIGDGGYRQRLTIFNAVRYADRWPDPAPSVSPGADKA